MNGNSESETESTTATIQTRIRKDTTDLKGWHVEPRRRVGTNVYQWTPKAWTCGTKRDAERLEREIQTELAKQDFTEANQ